jgi:hypothetical protein
VTGLPAFGLDGAAAVIEKLLGSAHNARTPTALGDSLKDA